MKKKTKEKIDDLITSLTIEEQDRILTTNFIATVQLTQEEFDHLYWQAKLIHEAINFETLRKYSYLRLRNSTQDIYHNLCLNIDDEKDGIYKQVRISPDNLSTTIYQCKPLNNGYVISECIEFWNEYEIYFSKILFKTTYPNSEEFLPLAYKKWLSNGEGTTLEEYETIDYNSKDLIRLTLLECATKEKKDIYTKCLSRNKN